MLLIVWEANLLFGSQSSVQSFLNLPELIYNLSFSFFARLRGNVHEALSSDVTLPKMNVPRYSSGLKKYNLVHLMQRRFNENFARHVYQFQGTRVATKLRNKLFEDNLLTRLPTYKSLQNDSQSANNSDADEGNFLTRWEKISVKCVSSLYYIA